jgi:hypothetical protein
MRRRIRRRILPDATAHFICNIARKPLKRDNCDSSTASIREPECLPRVNNARQTFFIEPQKAELDSLTRV